MIYANAEQSARAGEEPSAQAGELNLLVGELVHVSGAAATDTPERGIAR